MEGSGEGWDDGEISRKVGRSQNFAGIYHPVYILWSTILKHGLLQTKGKVAYLDELSFPGYPYITGIFCFVIPVICILLFLTENARSVRCL